AWFSATGPRSASLGPGSASARNRPALSSKVNLGTTAILGAGGWGTGLSVLWANKGHDVLLWGRTPTRVERIRENRENRDYLPGIKLRDSIRLTSDLAECTTADIVVFVTPSAALRTVASRFRQL